MPKTIKEFLLIYIPLAFLVALLAAWLLHSRNRSYLDLVSQRQASIVAQASRMIDRDVNLLASDVLFMARMIARHIHGAETINYQELNNDFIDFARSRPGYYVMRFLDAKGDERVRINRSFSGPVTLPAGALQYKGDKYYFRDAIQANKNDVYISNFDLNIEHGRIEIPYRPTLCFGCPVVDQSGRKQGVVVLNFDGKTLLKLLREFDEPESGITMLCNGDGFWMLGPRPEDEWGHVLEGAKNASMSTRFPSAWEAISHGDKGQLRTDNGLFSYNTVNVIPGKVISDVPPTTKDARKRWKIITWTPNEHLQVPWFNLSIVLVFLFLMLLATGCWQFVNNRIHREEFQSLLRENEERVLAISQSARDAIMMIDQNDFIIHWNPAAQRLFGYERNEAMTMQLHELLATDTGNGTSNEGLQAFMSKGRGKVFEGLLEINGVRKDGALVPVELALSPFRFRNKWYAVGSARDISNRKKHELELKRSEETSRALINATTDSAMLIEPHGAIIVINEIGAQQFGYSGRDMVGKNAFDYLSPSSNRNHKDTVLQVLQTGAPIRYEDKNGERVQLVNVYPVKGEDGAVVELAIFCRDVTEQRKAEAALTHSEQRFRDVSETVSEFIWETNGKGEYTFITEDVIQVLGFTAKELLSQKPYTLIPVEDRDDYRAWRNSVYERQEPFSNIEIQNVTKNGFRIWLQVSGAPYYDDNNEFQGFRGAAMNITDRKRIEEAIKANERKLRALAESAYDSIIMIDSKGKVSFWNHAAVKLFGYTEEEALGKQVQTLITPEEERDNAMIGLENFAVTRDDGPVSAVQEITGLKKDGTRFPVERSIASFKLGGEWCAVATIRDITERKATEAKLLELATTDSLTGLYNRRRFMELSEREFARSVRYDRDLALLMLDIDFFKKVNDTYGHNVGDEVLQSLSEISILALRNADIIGRLGGEEFAMLLPETGKEAALDVAERLRKSVERSTISTAGGDLNITVSIGVATRSHETNVIETLLKQADVALYDAKQSGRNKVVMG